jgi:2-polyprenyl-3-methyl-5-hydroxy-6-metoxy-1,4-benzoquinol methylase
MSQNIYDDPSFFAGYSQLARSLKGLAGAPEWPSLRALLPDIQGLRVVDLGCGFGWFCRWARENGAAHVLGLDLSEKMLTLAKAEPPDDAITYQRTDLERLELPEGAFDLTFRSRSTTWRSWNRSSRRFTEA